MPLDLARYTLDHFADALEADAIERGYEELTPDEEGRVAAAGADYHAFCEYVGADENRNPIRQTWFHRELCTFLCVNPRVVVCMAVEHAKTMQLVYRCIWKLGRRPESTAITIIMESAIGKAWKTIDLIKRMITDNVRVNRVFPGLRRGAVWRRDVITIAGHRERAPSVQAIGIGGAINGDRLTDIEADDLLTYENTRSRYQSDTINTWLEHEVLTRLLRPRGDHDPADFAPSGNFVLSGTPWQPWDAIAHFSAKPRFRTYRLPSIAVADVEEVRHPAPDTESKIAWPERFSLPQLQEILEDLGEVAFRRTHLLQSRDPSRQRFLDSWIIGALEAGAGMPLLERYAAQTGERMACGMDLAHADKVSRRDINAMVQLLWTGRMYRPLWLETDRAHAARWSPEQHVGRMETYHERYPPTTFAVESNYGQKHFAEFAQTLTRCRIEAVYTGPEKHDPRLGVEGIALMMERGQFLLPSGYAGPGSTGVSLQRDDGEVVVFHVAPEVGHLVRDMQEYSPEDRHIPDLLAALWKAFAQLGAVQGAPSMRGAHGLGAKPKPSTNQLRARY